MATWSWRCWKKKRTIPAVTEIRRSNQIQPGIRLLDGRRNSVALRRMSHVPEPQTLLGKMAHRRRVSVSTAQIGPEHLPYRLSIHRRALTEPNREEEQRGARKAKPRSSGGDLDRSFARVAITRKCMEAGRF